MFILKWRKWSGFETLPKNWTENAQLSREPGTVSGIQINQGFWSLVLRSSLYLESKGQSYKANFGINYIKNVLNKLNFTLNYINFDVTYAKKVL